jgi:hypothetical protein
MKLRPIPPRAARSGQFAQRPKHFGGFRKTSRAVLGEYQRPVCSDVEDAVVALDEFGFGAKLRSNLGRQTGGLREVISASAVGYRNPHCGPASLR